MRVSDLLADRSMLKPETLERAGPGAEQRMRLRVVPGGGPEQTPRAREVGQPLVQVGGGRGRRRGERVVRTLRDRLGCPEVGKEGERRPDGGYAEDDRVTAPGCRREREAPGE